jgi:hypothetical protein
MLRNESFIMTTISLYTFCVAIISFNYVISTKFIEFSYIKIRKCNEKIDILLYFIIINYINVCYKKKWK